LREYLRNYICNLYQIFGACCLPSWLDLSLWKGRSLLSTVVLFFFLQKKAATVEGDNISDDEIPADVNLNDPYFTEELSGPGHVNQMNGMI